MVAKELQLQSENNFKKITTGVSMIVNLQNVKHSLKADYSDG